MNNNNLNLNENNEIDDAQNFDFRKPEQDQPKLSMSDEICFLRSSGCDWTSISKHYGKSERWCRELIKGMDFRKPEPSEVLDKLYSSKNDPMVFINLLFEQFKNLAMECDSLKARQAEFESIVADKIKANILECDLDKYVLFNSRTKEELVLTDVEIAKYLNKNEQAICDLIKRRLVDKNEPELFLGNGFTVKLPKIRKINKYDFKDNEDKNTEDEDVEN